MLACVQRSIAMRSCATVIALNIFVIAFPPAAKFAKLLQGARNVVRNDLCDEAHPNEARNMTASTQPLCDPWSLTFRRRDDARRMAQDIRKSMLNSDGIHESASDRNLRC
jgi:hypothetical protein